MQTHRQKKREASERNTGGRVQSSDYGKKAFDMLYAFASVGARLFDVTTTDINGK